MCVQIQYGEERYFAFKNYHFFFLLSSTVLVVVSLVSREAFIWLLFLLIVFLPLSHFCWNIDDNLHI